MAWIFTTDGDYVNFNGGGNLWRLHKDSACISWHWDESGDLFFDVYDQEYYVKAGNIADVVINGTPLSAASGFPAAIQAVFTGLYSPGGGAAYSVYTANLTQTSTNAPVATEMENTIGEITPQYNNLGDYSLASSELFTEGKTVLFINNTKDVGNVSIAAFISGTSEIRIETWEANGDGTFTKANGYLIDTSIEIRVYP